MFNCTTKKILISILIAVSSFSHTQAQKFLPSFDTTRLKGTAGTGVASLLIDEANYLNPSSSAFLNVGSFYLQKSNISTTDNNNSTARDSDQVNFIASDSTGRSSGSVSYSKMSLGDQSVKNLGASLATPMGERSAIGVSYNNRKENILNSNNIISENSYNITTFGITHLLSESLTMGMVLKDAFRSKSNESRLILGVQYLYGSYISLMLDVGSDYKSELNEKFQWRTAAQIKILNDFYTRFGIFNDKGNQTKGSGIGIGWIQPKLTIEAAIKNTDVLESVALIQSQENIKETTLSLSYRF
jgi:hypothetical protein